MNPPRPFTTDGCSGGMSVAWLRVSGGPPPWEDACVEHDRAYWKGGSRRERLSADRLLRRQVRDRGYPFAAALMFVSVRVGGHPLLPFPWRWGYGWPFPKRYR